MPAMTHFQLSDTTGKTIQLPLDLGGFGISRYALDYHLYQQAQKFGAQILTQEKVTDLSFSKELFEVQTNKRTIEAKWLIGAFGKRSTLDKLLNRPFMNKRSPYMGVKYHVKNPAIPTNVVALHNFHGGYCGVNAVENDIVNVCYLAHRSVMDGHNSIPSMESEILLKNPELHEVFKTSEFLWDKPAVINEVSFETKAPVDNHILMCGDAAGMITPLCGNGMAIAMHSAYMLKEVLLRNPSDSTKNRAEVEEQYSTAWKEQFARRLGAGRHIQKLFGNGKLSSFSVQLGRYMPSVAHWLMAQTHGAPFN
jgi:flavin-dependent dehydrogenase